MLSRIMPAMKSRQPFGNRPERRTRAPVNPEDPREVGRRLRLIREHVLKYRTIKEMADRLGIAENRYGNYERGSPFPMDQALKLIKVVPGLDLNYIYTGRFSAGLDYGLVRLIEETEASEPGTAARRG